MEGFGDLLDEPERGDPISAEWHRIVVQILRRSIRGPGVHVDSSGVYIRPVWPAALESLIKNYELKTDLAGTYGASCTAYEIDADGNRIPGSEFTLHCGPACHEGDGSTESGAGYGGEGTGHTGSAAWKNGRWETQSMSCNVKPGA